MGLEDSDIIKMLCKLHIFCCLETNKLKIDGWKIIHIFLGGERPIFRGYVGFKEVRWNLFDIICYYTWRMFSYYLEDIGFYFHLTGIFTLHMNNAYVLVSKMSQQWSTPIINITSLSYIHFFWYVVENYSMHWAWIGGYSAIGGDNLRCHVWIIQLHGLVWRSEKTS